MTPEQKKNTAAQSKPEYRHSFMYRRHFEDYKTYEYVDAEGRVHKESVYTGRIYTPPFPPARYRLRKLLYAVLWLIACVLTYLAGSRALPVNMSPVTVALQIVEIVFLCWTMIGVCNYCLAPYQRTIGDQKTSTKPLMTGALLAAAALAAAAVEALVFLAIEPGEPAPTILCAVFYLVGAGLLLLLRVLEKRVEYLITVPSQEAKQN